MAFYIYYVIVIVIIVAYFQLVLESQRRDLLNSEERLSFDPYPNCFFLPVQFTLKATSSLFYWCIRSPRSRIQPIWL